MPIPQASLAAAAVLTVAAWAVSLLDGAFPYHLLYAVAILLGASGLLRRGARSLLARQLDMAVLMSAAVIGACLLGEWAEAASLVVLYGLAQWLEARGATRSRQAISELMHLAPSRVLVMRSPQQSGLLSMAAPVEVDAGDVEIGENFLVRAGERIALDGVVVSGLAQIDQAPVTGESVPVDKNPGDEVFAGTLNVGAVFQVRATHPAHEGTTARVARLMLEAQNNRAPRQRTVENFARFYTPIVFTVAVACAVLPPLWGVAWRDSVYIALALLVAACPCAFVLSGPVVTLCALTSLARRGVLVRGGAALEALADVRAIAFDKTGTLTRGTPTVNDFHLLPGAQSEYDEPNLIGIAAALEAQSTHPLAQALVEFAREKNVPSASAGQVEEQRGLGMCGEVAGRRYRIGTARFFQTELSRDDEARRVVESLLDKGRSMALLAREEADGCTLLAAIGFHDVARPEARAVMEQLQEAGIAVRTILSGDQEAAVRQVARDVNASHWRAGLSPEEKIEAVRELSRQHGVTAMVGDGINDAPALAQSSVGIAMGAAGSHAALEAADAALMGDDLRRLPEALLLARRARRFVTANITIALTLKLGFVFGVLLRIWGENFLIGGVISDVGASLLVTANGLRLLRVKRLQIEEKDAGALPKLPTLAAGHSRVL